MELIPFDYMKYITGKYKLITRNGDPVIFITPTASKDFPYQFGHKSGAYLHTENGSVESLYIENSYDVLMHLIEPEPVSPKSQLSTKYMLAKAIQANKHIEFIELVIKNTQGSAGLSTEEAIQAAYRIMILNFV